MKRTAIIMAFWLVCGVVAADDPPGPAWVPDLLTEQEATEGFYPLFNGKDLDGWWQGRAAKNAFAVEDGNLVVTHARGGGWLFFDREYQNYVLRLEYRCKPHAKSNSGVSIRATREGDPAFTGMEVQVLYPEKVPSKGSAGALYASVAPNAKADKPEGEWNSLEILCDGPRIRTLMNGKELYDISVHDFAQRQDDYLPLAKRPRSGYIALQDYGTPIAFRNIRLKPLPGGPGWRPLFNGRSLDGWEVVRDPIWSVSEDHTVRCDGTTGWDQGRNALRTTEEFDNFEMRLSAKLSNHANSGVFFRCSGDDPWPRTYESQLDNHDPRQFTGAIWDQNPATELRAMDNCWLHMHIVANGPNIEIAVNGKVVNQYLSPKHDKFTKGWITLQGHDPKSVVEFKDIEIKTVP